MQSISKHYKLVALFVACFCFASLASASVIVFRPGDLAGNPNAVGGLADPFPGGLSTDAVAVSWTQTAAFNNVFIQVFNLQNFNPGEMTVSFFLRSALDGADISTGSITVAGGAISNGQPFTGLTLDSGTYFLIASAPTFSGAWLGLEGGEETHAAASFGTEYIRNSENPGFTAEFTPLGVGYLVNGDLVNGGGGGAEVPEPGSWLLLGTGLLALGSFLHRRSLP
jgi:hypothetical protein